MQFDYADRNEDFENFFGFTYRQFKVGTSIRVSERFEAQLSGRFKNKNYGKYWTRNIGVNNRLSIDYADIQFKGKYALSDIVDFTFYLQSYNKNSNDPSFDYNDVTAGTGFSLRY